MITLFLYAVLFLLSGTILFIYILRWDTHMNPSIPYIEIVLFALQPQNFSRIYQTNKFYIFRSQCFDLLYSVRRKEKAIQLILVTVNIDLGFHIWPSWCSKQAIKDRTQLKLAFYASGEILPNLKTLFWNTVAHMSFLHSSIGSEITPNLPSLQLCDMFHPFHHLFPASVWRNFFSKKKKKKQQQKWRKIETTAELIQFHFIVAWNYLCGYASTSHISTQTHMWQYAQLPLFHKPYLAIGWKVDVFWYSMNM